MKPADKYLISGILAAFSLLSLGCEEENTSTLPALNLPGQLCVVEQCVINSYFQPYRAKECSEHGGTVSRMVFAANMGSSTVSYIPYYSQKSEFETIDITTSVPGVTSIPVGEMPQSMAADGLGAFVVLTSSVNNEISIIDTQQHREIGYQKLDKKPVKIAWSTADYAFHVFFHDGTVRKLTIDFTCPGESPNTLNIACVLSKENLTLTWSNIYQLEGTIAGYAKDPVRPVGYVSYKDKRYISVIAETAEAGSCLDGSSQYPCELKRLGAGFGCSDGIDNDGNGLIDSQDPSCFYPWSVEGSAMNADDIQTGWVGITGCSDFVDNNGNGLVDALDPGCVSSSDNSEEPGFQPPVYGTCGDQEDNDGDGDIDRADVKCRWPVNDESAENTQVSPSVGLCRDGIDNDGDGSIDASDLACYGPNGLSEVMMTSEGRGRIAVDPEGRWLYVLDPEDSQLIVIDLETGKTIDRSGWFPRNRVVGIPVSRLALDIVADIRKDNVYEKNGRVVASERAVVFISSSSGAVTEYSIHEKYTHYENDKLIKSLDMMTLRGTDNNEDTSYVGSVRCVGRICTETDLPEIDLRTRPTIHYFADRNQLTNVDLLTNQPLGDVYDSIMASEIWRTTYEGTLEKDERYDGYFAGDGSFRTGIDLCALGAIPGDHLIIRRNKDFQIMSSEKCQPFDTDAEGHDIQLEWRITDVGPNRLSIEPTGREGDASVAPVAECFGNALEYEIRASGTWLVTSRSTYVNRRLTVGKHCVDNPLNPFGQTRFSFNPNNPADLAKNQHAQTSFFSIKMPSVQRNYERDDAFEFTTRTGYSGVSIAVGSAPTSLALFKTDDVHYLLVSEASANSVVIYDIDEEGISDTL